ncbi:linker histone H1 and H5 family-domain-containing protein, partial [Gigaspora rosea]
KKKNMSAKASTSTKRPTYEEMIREAIIVMKERKGSSRQAIKKYITNAYRLKDNTVFNASFRKALNKGVEKELFEFVNGPMGTIKLKKKVEKPRTMTKLDEPSERSKTKVSKPKTTKKPSVVKDKKKVSKDDTVKKPSTAKTSKKTSTAKSLKKTSTVKSTKKASAAKVPKKTSNVKVPKKSSTRTTRSTTRSTK